MPSSTPVPAASRAAVGLAVVGLAVLAAAGAGLASEHQPPPPPPAYHGSLTVDGDPAPASVSVTAHVDGEQRGCLTTADAGSYGGPGGFDPKLVVDGTDADEGAAVTFEVNGAPASPGEPVAWSAADVREVNLTADALGDDPLCARTATDGEDTITVEAENIPAGETVSTDLPALEASDATGLRLDRLDVTAARDLPELSLDVTLHAEAPEGVDPPETADGQPPVAYFSVKHDLGDDAIEEAAFAFHVEEARLEELGLAPEDVVLHHDDGTGWEPLAADLVEETATGYSYEATTPGFSVFAPAGDSGGAGSGDGAPDPPAETDVTVEPGEAFDVDAGATVTVAPLPGVFQELVLDVGSDCTGCVLRAEALDGPPNPLPDGFQVVEVVNLTLVDGNGDPLPEALEAAWLAYDVEDEDLPAEADAQQATLLHHEEGAWRPESASSRPAGEPGSHVVHLDGLSPFALAVDEDPPRISDRRPAPGTEVSASQPVVVGAAWSDNRGVDPASLRLSLDGGGYDDPAEGPGHLSADGDGFAYVLAESEIAGDRTEVSLRVSDESGLIATDTWTFDVAGESTGEQEGVAEPDDAEDNEGSWPDWGLWSWTLVVALVLGVAGAAAYLGRDRLDLA